MLNPRQVLGQLEGAAPAFGLALTEELVVDNGTIRNRSFTEHLSANALGSPDLRVAATVEEPS